MLEAAKDVGARCAYEDAAEIVEGWIAAAPKEVTEGRDDHVMKAKDALEMLISLARVFRQRAAAHGVRAEIETLALEEGERKRREAHGQG
jgi:hypothetical protein